MDTTAWRTTPKTDCSRESPEPKVRKTSERGDAMSRNIIYLDDGMVPHGVPVGRVLMHNHFPHDADTPSGASSLCWRHLRPAPF